MNCCWRHHGHQQHAGQKSPRKGNTARTHGWLLTLYYWRGLLNEHLYRSRWGGESRPARVDRPAPTPTPVRWSGRHITLWGYVDRWPDHFSLVCGRMDNGVQVQTICPNKTNLKYVLSLVSILGIFHGHVLLMLNLEL